MSIESLSDDMRRADDAYTRAIQDAAQTGNWYMVAPAKHAARQARAALKAAKETL